MTGDHPNGVAMAHGARAAPPQSPFRLADWHVDATSDHIRQGDTGHKLESKMMAVLVYLATRAGEVVTREELERDVWHGRTVGYDALTGCITKLRKILGDDSRNPRYIETISKRGYRLIAPVSPLQTDAVAPPVEIPEHAPAGNDLPHRPHRSWMAAVVAMLALAVVLGIMIGTGLDRMAVEERGQPSIAVLPFNNLSNDAMQDYFSDGITADITTALSNHSGLFVIAHPSAVRATDQGTDLIGTASALGVRYVLQGSVRRADSRLRVNAQLIDARTGIHLWAERYDRELKDVLDVQDEIAARIVGALEVKLTEEEKRRIARGYTVSVDAYDAFLRGQAAYARYTSEDNLQAQSHYRRAIELEPEFARAYSGLAMTLTADHRFGWNTPADAGLSQARDLARKAVELDGALPQARWVLGHVYLYLREYRQAMEETKRAVQLNPNLAESYIVLASGHIFQGDAEAALPLVRKAMRLNPHYPAQYASTLGQAYYFTNQYEDAVTSLRDAIERNANLLPSHIYLVAALSALGKNGDAAWTATQLRALAPDFKAEDVRGMFPIENEARLAAMVDRLRRAGL